MGSKEGKLNSDLEQKIFQIFKDFLERVTKFEELVAVGARLLAGFQQGLVYLRQPPIDSSSELVKNIIKANETKRVKSYIEGRCINSSDGMHNMSKLSTCQLGLQDYLSKAKSILIELECLLEDVTGAVENANGTEDFGDGLNEQATMIDEEEVASPCLEKPEVTDYAVMTGIIYSMVKQDYAMQERIISALNFKTSSEELEGYCLMWSLRPFINDEIMHQAWKLIP